MKATTTDVTAILCRAAMDQGRKSRVRFSVAVDLDTVTSNSFTVIDYGGKCFTVTITEETR